MPKDKVDMPDVAKAFSKRKQNISDEERQRRRERMLELRKKLGQVSKAKQAKKVDEPPIEKEQEVQSESDSSSSEDEAPIQPAKQANKGAKSKPAKSKPKSKHVKKVVKIKYYGDISKDEMDYDTKLLANIHSNDNEYEERKLSRKEERKKLKEKQKPATELYEPAEDIPEPNPEPVVDPEKEKLDRAIKSLWG